MSPMASDPGSGITTMVPLPEKFDPRSDAV